MTKTAKEVKALTRTGENMGEVTLESVLARIDVKERFKEMLGRRAAAFMSSIVSAVHMNPDLRNCEPMSIVSSAAVAASLDLPINPNLSFAHIVPYAGVATFQMGWRGFVQLGLRTEKYQSLHAGIVYDGELKEYNHITGDIKFNLKGRKIDKKTGQKTDKIIGYVGYLRLLSGFEKYLYMTVEECMEHALKYSKLFSSKGKGQWKTNFDAMSLKTVLKMLLGKYGIMTIEMERAIISDEAAIGKDGTPEYIDGKIIEDKSGKPEVDEPEALDKGKEKAEGCKKCADPKSKGEHTCGKKTNKSEETETGKEKKVKPVTAECLISAPVGTVIPLVEGIVESCVTKKPKKSDITEYTVIIDDKAYIIKSWGQPPKNYDDGKTIQAKNVKISLFRDERQYLAESVEIIETGK